VILRNRSVAALLVAETVSTTGSQMTWLALPWFVLTTSGSATRMSLVVGAEIVGLGLLGLPGGKLLRLLGARRTMLVCDTARAPLAALIPGLHWAGLLTFPALLAIAFALGALSAPYFTAQRVIVPELLGEDERVVSQASALFQTANRLTFLLGPPLGGILIGLMGAAGVLVVDAVSYCVAVALVAGFVPRRPPLTPEEGDQGVRAGLRFLLREPLLRSWNLALAVGDAAWTAFFITVPVLVVVRFDADPRIAGVLIAAFGVGAVAGNAIAYRLVRGRVDGLTIVATFIMGQALPLWLVTLDVPARVLVGALALSGVANGLVNPSLHAIMTLRVPPALRPSVMSTMMIVFALVQPLGVFGAGPVLDRFGPTPVLVAFAAVQTAMMATVALAALRARVATRMRLAEEAAA
jgi:MFS family permease